MDLYEEKYKAALGWMQSLYGGLHGATKEEAEKYFPELKESEGERIRKKLISFVENWKNFRPNSPFDDYAVYTSDRDECDRILAWLEKQGEQNFDYEHADIPQKDFAPIEPKFKVGDWVVYDHIPYQVVELPKEGYINLGLRRNGKVEFAPSHYCRHWTLQDAKDGDVLACNEEILLFKSYSIQGRISLYCWYNGQTNNFHSKEVDNTLLTTRNKICPATKEQRDLLFQKMADAGYEWNNEKKELKKIETTAWSEEDEKIALSTEQVINCASLLNIVPDKMERIRTWLKTLKQRI